MSTSTRFLRRRTVEQTTGLSTSSLYAMVKKGEFPNPVRLGSNTVTVAWIEAEIDEWKAARIAERDHRGKAA